MPHATAHRGLPGCVHCGSIRGPWVPSGDRDRDGAQLFVCAPGHGCKPEPIEPAGEGDHLTARQLDGVDCDHCGAPLDRAGVISVPTGYVDGFMVFRCGPCIEADENLVDGGYEGLVDDDAEGDRVTSANGRNNPDDEPKNQVDALGARLSALVDASGLSRAEIADKVGISAEHLEELLLAVLEDLRAKADAVSTAETAVTAACTAVTGVQHDRDHPPA